MIYWSHFFGPDRFIKEFSDLLTCRERFSVLLTRVRVEGLAVPLPDCSFDSFPRLKTEDWGDDNWRKCEIVQLNGTMVVQA